MGGMIDDRVDTDISYRGIIMYDQAICEFYVNV